MAGKIKFTIDKVIAARSKGDATIATTTKIKLTLKGINPDLWTEHSEDDPAVIGKLNQIAKEFGITL